MEEMPVNAAEFYRRLDEYYGAGKRPEAYAFMKEQKAEAERRGDDSMSLTIANALLGYCREFCLFDEMDGLYAEAVRCIEALGLQGTMEEAITLLNAATGFCVMGREAQSEELYRKTIALHEELLPPGVDILFIYISKEVLPFADISAAMGKILSSVSRKSNEQGR